MERRSVWIIQSLKELIPLLQVCTWDDQLLDLEMEEVQETEIAEGARAHITGTEVVEVKEVAGVATDLDQDLTPVDVVTPHPVDVRDHTLHADIEHIHQKQTKHINSYFYAISKPFLFTGL